MLISSDKPIKHIAIFGEYRTENRKHYMYLVTCSTVRKPESVIVFAYRSNTVHVVLYGQ